jgi:hypothetical protein
MIAFRACGHAAREGKRRALANARALLEVLREAGQAGIFEAGVRRRGSVGF